MGPHLLCDSYNDASEALLPRREDSHPPVILFRAKSQENSVHETAICRLGSKFRPG